MGAVALAAQAGVWDVDYLNGLMTGTEEVPPNASTASGGELGVGMQYDDTSKILTLNAGFGTFGYNVLQGTFQNAHVHIGALGVNGPVTSFGSLTNGGAGAGWFAFGANGGVWNNYQVTLNPTEETDLFNGNLYINVHSSLFPGGEIRGQLSVIPEPSTWALGALGLALIAVRRWKRA
jgi:hypothetical protein